MAFLKDKASGRFWKQYGSGLTDKPEDAHHYSTPQALVLVKLFWDTITLLTDDKIPGVFTEYGHTPDLRQSPIRTQVMKDRDYVWVQYEGAWCVASVQDLAMTTLLTLGAKTPSTPPTAPTEPPPRAA